MNLLCVIPFHQGDVLLASKQLKWIAELNGTKDHSCLLIVDSKCGLKAADTIITLAWGAFHKVAVSWAENCDGGWPIAANKMFKHAAGYIAQREHQPFLWCEPDCVPIRTSWLTEIANAYASCSKPFMGPMVTCDRKGLPALHMNGNAVYPHNTIERLGGLLDSEIAFDLSCADLIVPEAVMTPLIYHIWGKRDLAPTFSEHRHRDGPENTLTIANIPSKTALFHRCKDGTLIDLLRRRWYTNSQEPIIHNYRGQKREDVVADTA